MGLRDPEAEPLLDKEASKVKDLQDKDLQEDFRFHKWSEWVQKRYTDPYDPEKDHDFWYMSKRRWLTDLSAFPNWSLFVHYFNNGIALNLLVPPVTFYLVESLNASAAVVNTYTAVTYLPWCLKIFFGLQSDLVPWFGMHRRSYFIFGWAVFVLSNLWLAILGSPGIAATLILSFTMTLGCLVADTVADAIVLELSRYEADSEKGRMRTKAYIVRQVGSTLGSVAGAVLYNSSRDGGTWSWGLSIAGCFWLQGGLVLFTQGPLALFMYELPIMLHGKPSSWHGIWRDMFDFISFDGVWIPMMFLYMYSACFVSNPAWYNFLYDGLGFSNLEVGLLYAVGSVLSVVGLVAYDKFFFTAGWRSLYFWTTVVTGFFSFLQVLLITGDTFGLPKIIFATGDVSLQEFFQTLTFMPMCIMFFSMIPDGTEGTAYALISTWTNVAGEVGTDIGTALACSVDVRNRAIRHHNWTGLLKLTLICSGIQILPIFGIYANAPSGKIRLLPDNIAETKAQALGGRATRSPWGAWLFFSLFVGSIVASIAESLWVIFFPSSSC